MNKPQNKSSAGQQGQDRNGPEPPAKARPKLSKSPSYLEPVPLDPKPEPEEVYRQGSPLSYLQADLPPAKEPKPWLFPRKVALLDPYLPPQLMLGMLYRGCRFIVGGPPKAKKSWLLMLCCYCVANGLDFLEIPTTKGKVLYINFELLEGECRARFTQIQQAIGVGSLDNIEVIQLRDKTLSDKDLSDLESIIAKAGFCLSAFDPVYKLLNGRDERVGKDVAPVLNAIAGISNQAKSSVGFSAHFAKGNQALKFAIDRISGSNYFARDADVIMIMSELNEANSYAIEIIQRSFLEIKPFAIRWHHPLFTRDNSLDPTDLRQPGKTAKPDPTIERMLATLHGTDTEGGLGFTPFLRAIQIKGPAGNLIPSKATFVRKLDSLLAKKMIFKSAATGNYMISPEYAEKRMALLDQVSDEVSSI